MTSFLTPAFKLDLSNSPDNIYCGINDIPKSNATPATVEIPLPDGVITGFTVFVERGNNSAMSDINYEVIYNNTSILSDTIATGTDGVFINNLNVSTSNNQTVYIVFKIVNSGGICPINGCRLDLITT